MGLLKEYKRMMELAGILCENPDIGKNRWKEVDAKTLKKYSDEVLELVKNAYKEVGGHPNYKSISDITMADAQMWELIDLDDDPDIDAVDIKKKRNGGNKLVGMGHDGSSPAKRSVIGHQIDLLKKPGYYIEVSGKMLDILKAAGIKIVDDEETVRKVLKGKPIKWNGDGTYQRSIKGDSHAKVMMGHPRAKS
jgi:hypothetical protein